MRQISDNMIIELFSINVVSYIYDDIVVESSNEVITSLPNVICDANDSDWIL